ncbi:hypothetical protein BCON_0092g00030 [Botryotinia convoluta]|uniref:Uncharacterized protein n=1 Tax=Botryotinia convoluta TaxID=54673 RepID=A0A4Z1I971_9HELO|nr:hypothetical protein BCON_0092g00030 [Botryotinia convoluta]
MNVTLPMTIAVDFVLINIRKNSKCHRLIRIPTEAIILGNAGYVSLQKLSDEADSVSKAYIPDEFDAKPSHAAMQSTFWVNNPRS